MNGILRRKLRPAQEAEAPPHALVDQAWRLALSRALREGAGLPAEASALSSRACGLDELPELPPERALIALLDGPGDAMGIAVLSPELTAAIIETQTIGRLGTVPPAPRRPTRTDAAMIAPVLDRALSRFDFLVRDLPDRRVGDGFRFASLLDDARSIGLLLDDLPYHLMSCTLSLANGARNGELLLALPLAPASPQQAAKDGGATETDFAADLGQTECELLAVLGRRMFTLSEVMQLEPGQLLTLHDASLARVSLRGIDGKAVAMARLGQQNGYRALRISAVAATPDQGGEAAAASAGMMSDFASGLPAAGPADSPDLSIELAGMAPGFDIGEEPFGTGEGMDFRVSA